MEQPAPTAYTGWISLDNGEQRELAGMGRRLWARIIDGILLAAAASIALAVLFNLLADDELAVLVAILLAVLVFWVVTILYEVSMIAVWGRRWARNGRG